MGQIASFMDILHLTYDEVVYRIPYRNLIVMQKDKVHTVYGDEAMQEMDEAEFFKKKGLKFSE